MVALTVHQVGRQGDYKQLDDNCAINDMNCLGPVTKGKPVVF